MCISNISPNKSNTLLIQKTDFRPIFKIQGPLHIQWRSYLEELLVAALQLSLKTGQRYDYSLNNNFTTHR